jgi:hypothetical protein
MVISKKYDGTKIICEYNSSNLKSASYDTTTNKLNITFSSGTTYEYDGVPHTVFSEMNLTESQGSFFNKNIAKKYSYKKL